MRKIKLLIIIIICLFITNVKADMGAPIVVTHKVVVTNKNGAICYVNEKKTDKVIPYGTTLEVYNDIAGSFIYVSDSNEKYNCDVKYADVSAKDQSFTINEDNATKITPIKRAIVLAKGGLNMRKGPSVTYSKIVTIPEKTIITIDYISGSYWYHTTYNGKSGWITGMDGYLGIDGKEVLINFDSVKIYGAGGKTVLGTIPANTEIEEYIELSGTPYSDLSYYVIYNGIKGYIKQHMLYKTDGIGKIKLLKDVEIQNDNGEIVKKITGNQELEYNMKDGTNGFYFPAKKIQTYLDDESFKYIKDAKILTKSTGYIGEGLFGEEKLSKEEMVKPEKEETKESENEAIVPKEERKDISNIIIIGLLAGIFAALTALVIIKLVNSKKKTVVEKPKEETKKEIEQITVTDREIAKAREEIIREMKKERLEENNRRENDDNKEV